MTDLLTPDQIREYRPITPNECRLHATLLDWLNAAWNNEKPPVPEFTRQHAITFLQTYNALALYKVGVAQLDALDMDCCIQALQKAVER